MSRALEEAVFEGVVMKPVSLESDPCEDIEKRSPKIVVVYGVATTVGIGDQD